MNILLLSHVFPPRIGGSGRWLWELYRRLPGVGVSVAAGDVDGAASFDRTAGLPITRLSLDFAGWGLLSARGAWQYGRAALAVDRIVRRCRPDVLHCGKCLPEGLLGVAIKWRRGIPFYCYAHGEELALARTSRELATLTGWVLRHASNVVANSHHTKTLLRQEWNLADAKVTVMHPGVDTTRFAPATAGGDVRSRLGWSDRQVILTVGALQKRKGQDMMIRALPAIRARCPRVLYAIVGEGWKQSYLRELAAEHGVADLVEFHGVAGDVELIEYYQACDVFALPNRQVGWDFEGFGIALLEAQACGKPVIAGLSGGAPETVQAGQTGEVVPCDSPEPLAEAAIAMLEQPAARAAMGRRGRDWVVEHFDWDILTRQAYALFTT